MLINTDAITLHSRKYGDSSKIVTYFTREEGRVSVIAKGARSLKSKYGSSLEPMSICRIAFYKKPNRDLHLLSGSESTTSLKKLYESPEHIIYGLAIIESASQTINSDEKNEELFSLLIKSIILLNEKIENPFSLFAYSQLQLAEILGFGLELARDEQYMDTDGDSKGKVLLSLHNGGIDRRQLTPHKDYFMMEPEIVNRLIAIGRSPFESCFSYCFTDAMRPVITSFFSRYFSFHLDKVFKYRSLSLMEG